MTSNLGSELIAEHAINLRNDRKNSENEKISETGLNDANNIQISRKFRERTIKPILKRAFRRDEFIGRINEIVYFVPFDELELKELTIRQLNAWSKRADLRHGISMSWSNRVVTVLSDAYDVSYGARSIQHEVDRRIVNKLAEAFETGRLRKGDHVHFEIAGSLEDEEIVEKFGSDLSNVPIRLIVNDKQI